MSDVDHLEEAVERLERSKREELVNGPPSLEVVVLQGILHALIDIADSLNQEREDRRERERDEYNARTGR